MIHFLVNFLAVFARPTEHASTDECENVTENDDKTEVDSSPSSSDDDDIKNSGASTTTSRLSSVNESRSPCPSFEDRYDQKNSCNEHSSQDSTKQNRHVPLRSYAANDHSPSQTLWSTSLDQAPSEANILSRGFHRENDNPVLHGAIQNTAYSRNTSQQSLSADDLTIDARQCAVPRVKRRMIKTKAKHEEPTSNTQSMLKGEEHVYSGKNNQADDSLRDFIKDLVKKQTSLEPNEKFYDAAIVYAKDDYENVMRFKEEIMTIVKSELNEEARLELFDSQEFAQSKVHVVEDVLDKCSVVFIYLTTNFKSPELLFFTEEAVGISRLGLGNGAGNMINDRRWILKPVHTSPHKLRKYKVPVGLLSLNGIEWYNKNSAHTRQHIRALMLTAINARKQNEMQTGMFHQYSKMVGTGLTNGNNVPSMDVPPHTIPRTQFTLNLQPGGNQPFMSHQSNDAMSVLGVRSHIQHTQSDLLSSRRFFSSTSDRAQHSQDGGNTQHLQDFRADNVTEGLFHFDGNTSKTSGQDMSPSVHKSRFVHPGYVIQSAGLQHQNMHHDIRDDFQRSAVQLGSLQHQGRYVHQIAGSQRPQGNYEPFTHQMSGLHQGFTNQSQQPFYYSNGAPIPENFSTNQATKLTRPVLQGDWNQQNLGQPSSRLQGNLSQQYFPDVLKTNAGRPNLEPVPHYTRENVLQRGFLSHNQDQSLSRDALHSDPVYYPPNESNDVSASTRVSVVSKITGKLIVNPNLSTDDVEVDFPIQTESSEAIEKTHKRKGKRTKQGKTSARYESEEETDSDSDFEFSMANSKNGNKVVNIVGCKVVQMGDSNKYKESQRKSAGAVTQTRRSKLKSAEMIERSEETQTSSVSKTFSPKNSFTKQDRKPPSAKESISSLKASPKNDTSLISTEGNGDLFEDNLSFDSLLWRNIDNRSKDKDYPGKKSISASLLSSHDAVPSDQSQQQEELNSHTFSRYNDLQNHTSRNTESKNFNACKNIASFEENKRSSVSGSDGSNDDNLFESGTYISEHDLPTSNITVATPFAFSRQAKGNVLDIFVGRINRKCETYQQTNEYDSFDSEVD